MEKRQSNEKTIACVDLFCGAGGLTHGLIKAHLPVVAGVDIDPDCEFPFMENNAGAQYVLSDIRNVSGTQLLSLFGDADIKVLAGCAPCQPFSTYSHRYEPDKSPESRWRLLEQFLRLAKESHPDVITMENVPQLEKQDVFLGFVSELRGLGYEVTYEVVDCADLGLPQSRKRLVLLAARTGGRIILSKPRIRKKKSVSDAIGNLVPVAHGEVDSKDVLHRAASLSGKNLKRIKHSKPGGTWEDWPQHLRADCHLKKSGNTYKSVYARMRWDQPSPTMTTQFYGFGNGRFGHPDQDRALTLREGAILQGFPKTYKFTAPGQEVRMTTIGRLIGNAVPVRLGEVIGKSIVRHFASQGIVVVPQRVSGVRER